MVIFMFFDENNLKPKNKWFSTIFSQNTKNKNVEKHVQHQKLQLEYYQLKVRITRSQVNE